MFQYNGGENLTLTEKAYKLFFKLENEYVCKNDLEIAICCQLMCKDLCFWGEAGPNSKTFQLSEEGLEMLNAFKT